MALTRRGTSPEGAPLWEVDRSGLFVQQTGKREWQLTPGIPRVSSTRELIEYLQRHALWKAGFSSRARALDAACLALARSR